jgi:integrase
MQMLPTGRAYEKRPRRAMSEDEVERFVAAAFQIDEEQRARAMAEKSGGRAGKVRLRPIPQTPLWIALIETGARFGELTSTTWADLSESRATLTLRAPTTKSRKERVLPLRRELLDLLRALRVAQHDRLGRIPGPGDRIFVTVQGQPWNESRSYIATRFRQILDRAGIQRVDSRGEKLDVHALRHTAASRMARSGVGLVLAQKILGHSDPRLTAAVYSHLGVEDLREAVEMVPGLRVAGE